MKHLILLVGLPGSGKTTMCASYPEYVRISQDDQGKDGHKKIFKQALFEGKDIIVDRCNFNTQQRNRYLNPAKQAGYKTTIIYLKVSSEECLVRLKERENHPTLWKDHPKLESILFGFDELMEYPERYEADEVIWL